MELRRPRAGAKVRCLCVGVLTLLGLCLWTASAGAQVYPATETVQLASSGGPPGDGLLHVGPNTIDGPLYRALLRFDVPAFDSERLLRATLVLDGGSCYLGEAPLIAARPVLAEWGPDSNWDDQPETGGEVAVGSGGVCPDRDERIDITSLVRDWWTGAAPNFGLELHGDESFDGPPVYETPDGPADGLDRRFERGSIFLEVELVTGPAPPVVLVDPALLTGVLLDEFGLPVSDGVVSVSQTVDTEASVDTPQLASATTDSSGAFLLRLSPTDPAIAAIAAANDGWVNFDAAFIAGNRVQSRSFSRQVVGGAWATGESRVTIQFDSAAAIGAHAPGVRTGFSEADPSHARLYCYVTTTKLGEADKYMVIGEAHAWKDQAMTWVYGEQADSDVGVGYSTDGVHWSLSGSVHISSKRASEITDTISNLGDDNGNFGRRYRTEFRFVKQRQRLVCLGRVTTTYRIKATRWNGGFDYYDDVKDLNGHCGDRYESNAVYFAPASGNGTFSRTNGKLKTYKAAVTVFGVSLSGRTGASKSASQFWRFGRRFTRYYLCGDTGKPTVSERIFAGF